MIYEKKSKVEEKNYSLTALGCPNGPTSKIMLSNMAHKATVYKTGELTGNRTQN